MSAVEPSESFTKETLLTPVFDLRMFAVEDFEVVPAGREELACFFERDTVLFLFARLTRARRTGRQGDFSASAAQAALMSATCMPQPAPAIAGLVDATAPVVTFGRLVLTS